MGRGCLGPGKQLAASHFLEGAPKTWPDNQNSVSHFQTVRLSLWGVPARRARTEVGGRIGYAAHPRDVSTVAPSSWRRTKIHNRFEERPGTVGIVSIPRPKALSSDCRLGDIGQSRRAGNPSGEPVRLRRIRREGPGTEREKGISPINGPLTVVRNGGNPELRNSGRNKPAFGLASRTPIGLVCKSFVANC